MKTLINTTGIIPEKYVSLAERIFESEEIGEMELSPSDLYLVGDMYRNGWYVERDQQLAFELYKRCYGILSNRRDRKHIADVCIRLSDCFMNGTGVKQNLRFAVRFASEAEKLFSEKIIEGDTSAVSGLMAARECMAGINGEGHAVHEIESIPA